MMDSVQYNKLILTPSIYKLTIDKINENYRFILIGILNKKQMNKIINNNMIGDNVNGILFLWI